MANSTVSITIAARDLTSRAFRSVADGLDTVGNRVQRVNRRIEALGRLYRRVGNNETRQFVDSGVRNLLRLNTALLAVDVTTQALGATFNTLGNAIGDALHRETSEMQSVNTVIQTLKLGAVEAADFVQDFNKQIAITGQSLPVSADKIRVFSATIIDDYAAALSAAGATANQVRSVLLEDSTRLAIAQASAGTTDGEAQAAIASFLSGATGVRGLNTYKFFANNVSLKNALSSAVESRGITSLSEISAFDRIRLLNQALEVAFPQESIDRLKSTGQAKISAFGNLLFGELGIFSLTRDLDESTRGYQSVYTSFKDTLDVVIGERGILAQLGGMSGLQSTSFLVGVQSVVEGINGFLGDFSSAIEGVSSYGIGLAVGDLVADVVNGIVLGIGREIAHINWVNVAKGLVGSLVGFVTGLDWRVYLAAAGVAAAIAIKPLVVGLAVAAVGTIGAAVAGVPVAIGAAIVLGVTALTKLIVDNFDRIKAVITGMFEAVVNRIKGLFGDASAGEKVTPPVVHTYSDTLDYGFGTGATGFLPAWAKEMSMAPGGSYPIIANSSEAILTQAQLSGMLARAAGGGGGTVNIGAINLNLPEGTPVEIAHKALQILEDEIVQRLEAAIA